MQRSPTALDIPLGRVEFLGQVLHIIEHDGRLVAAANDESGMPVEALAAPRFGGSACRKLMRDAVDLLFEAADSSLVLSAFSNGRSISERRPVRRDARLKISTATMDPGP